MGEYEAPEPEPSDQMSEQLPELLEELGAVIHLKKGDLKFASQTDTFLITGVEGYYLFDQKIFRGQDGIVDWSNLGVPEAEKKVRLSQFEFGVKQRTYKFENVLLSQPEQIAEPVSGELYLNIHPSRKEKDTYPRFISYAADTPIKGLGSEKLTFKGGINYHGLNFYSRSTYNEISTLSCTLDGVVKFKARSKDFVFNSADSLVTADDAELTLYHESDSIYHPSIVFNYNYKNDLLSAKTSVKGYNTTPFRSSFYNLDITGDVLTWDLNSDSLDIIVNSARAETPLVLESKDFFSAQRFHDLAQIFSFHPLIMAVSMAKRHDGIFYTSQMAKANHLDEALVNKTMELLMSKGMVKYDRLTGRVEVLEKGYHYEASAIRNPEYDKILIPSIISNAPNSTMNFKDSVLTVRGVRQFQISDSLDVLITPARSEIKVLQNRDIAFDGTLDAGNIQFNGNRFTFEYDSFRVNLSDINVMEVKLEIDERKRKFLNNKLLQTAGVLQINATDNKSGLKSMPKYPVFNSSKNAKVFFNQKEILNGIYDSTVYFDAPPFEMDSLASTDPNAYKFRGILYSGGILPDLEEDLKVMPDKNFGFTHTIPESGYNLYNTKGKLHGELRMDGQGLTSSGTIEYLTGNFEMQQATLFPDSLVSEKGTTASLKEGFAGTVSYPSLYVEDYSMHWLPKSDSMILKNLEVQGPFQIFDKQARLKGALFLRKTGLFGTGKVEIQGAELTSDSIAFSGQSLEATHTAFVLNNLNASKPILKAKDTRIHFDVSSQKATIEPEVAGTPSLEFPYARFRTSIPSAVWDVEQKTVIMTKPEGIPLEQSRFYSTNKSLDSLAFNASDAFYDIEKKELTLQGIPFIKVADAKITPEENKLTILENTRIQKLENAVIVIDTANEFHRLYNAEVEIVSRTSFRGKGTYEFVNAVQDTFSIQFDQFRFVKQDPVNGPHTKSSGTVIANQGIRISPGFIYRGRVTMYAYRKALELNGAVKLDMKNANKQNIWIEYISNDDIEEVIIPFDQARTSAGQPLNAGIHFDRRTREVYMSFITRKRNSTDDDFFVPRGGNLYYDAKNKAYRIESSKKTKNPAINFAGNMFSYSELSRDISFEGKLNFLRGNNFSNIQAAGKGVGNLDSANYTLDAMFVLSFGLPVEGLAAMGQDLIDMGEQLGVPRAHEDRSELIYRVAEFIGDEATRNWDESYQAVPISLVSASANEELTKDLVLTNVHLKWSEQHKAFYSEGKISVSNVSNIDLNMKLDGFVEIRKTPKGDILTVLLEMTDGTWYYFTYDGSRFGSFSSNKEYNATIERSNSGKYKERGFKMFTRTIKKINRWASDFKKLYYGVDEPHKLLMAIHSDQTLKKKKAVEGDGF